MSANIRFWIFCVLAVLSLYVVIFKTGFLALLGLGAFLLLVSLAIREVTTTDGRTRDIIGTTDRAARDVSSAATTAYTSARSRVDDIVKGKK